MQSLLPSPQGALWHFAKYSRKVQLPPRFLAWVQQWQPASGSKTCLQRSGGVRFALNHPLSLIHWEVGNQRGELTGNQLVQVKLEPVLAPVMHTGLWRHNFLCPSGAPGSCEEPFWQKSTCKSCPDSGGCWDITASKPTPAKATAGFQPKCCEAERSYSMWSGVPAAFCPRLQPRVSTAQFHIIIAWNQLLFKACSFKYTMKSSV